MNTIRREAWIRQPSGLPPRGGALECGDSMNLTPESFVLLLAFGLAIGALSGFFGVGGGAFLVPALVRLAGLGWPEANGLSLTQMIPTAATGAWRRWRLREVHPRLAALCVCGSIPGAWLGHRVVATLDRLGTVAVAGREIGVADLWLTVAFSLAVGYMGRKMLKPDPPGTAPAAEESADGAGAGDRAIPPHEGVALGAAVGFTSALLGIGGGFVFVPVAVQRFGLSVGRAVGTSLFQMPVTAAAGAILYGASSAPIPYMWLVPLLAGSLVGVSAGVSFSRRFDNAGYRRILGRMLLFVAAFLTVGLLWKN